MSSENITLVTSKNFSMKLFCSRARNKTCEILLHILSFVMQEGCRVRLCGFPKFTTFLHFRFLIAVLFENIVGVGELISP